MQYIKGGTNKRYRLEDTRLSLLRYESHVDVWRDLEIVPFGLVHRLRVWYQAYCCAYLGPMKCTSFSSLKGHDQVEDPRAVERNESYSF